MRLTRAVNAVAHRDVHLRLCQTDAPISATVNDGLVNADRAQRPAKQAALDNDAAT